jgi:hypothetical protein
VQKQSSWNVGVGPPLKDQSSGRHVIAGIKKQEWSLGKKPGFKWQLEGAHGRLQDGLCFFFFFSGAPCWTSSKLMLPKDKYFRWNNKHPKSTTFSPNTTDSKKQKNISFLFVPSLCFMQSRVA